MNFSDVGVIEDFSINEDLIQLHGSASDYTLQGFSSGARFGSSGLDVGTGIGILTSQREIIAIVEDVNNLDLNSSNFEYV